MVTRKAPSQRPEGVIFLYPSVGTYEQFPFFTPLGAC